MAKTRRAYSGNAASTTLASGISSADATITITAATGWPSGAPFYVVIDPGTASEEKILVTRSSTTLTVSGSRGADDTSAASHSAGATIYPVFTAVDANEANLLASTLTTQGDLLTHGASDFARVAIGTAGQVLKVNSGATAPEWGQVATAGIADSAVTSAKIADGTIVAGDIADGAITSAKILDGTIATGDLADGAVTSAKIADGTIVAGDIADGAITSAKILDGTIATGDIADGAITSAKIADGTIATGDIADGAITSAKIDVGTIVAGNLATGAVTSAKILDGTIATGDIADGAITSAKIANSTIVNEDISGSANIHTSKLDGSLYKRKLSGAVAITTATDTDLNFDSLDTNQGSPGIGSSAGSIAPTTYDGVYLFAAGINFAANATGVRSLRIRNFNTGEVYAESTITAFSGRDNVLNCTGIATLSAGQEIVVEVYQNSGGNLNIKADDSTFFAATLLGKI